MAKDEQPPVYVVLESFVFEEAGAPVTYRKGEPVDPADPAIRRWPDRFGPLEFPHPVRHARVAPPEVRS